MLENRDYTIIIDRSGSMATPDVKGKTRWEAAKESTIALASEVEKYDPDGLTVYTFSDKFKRYENVTAQKVVDVFAERGPMGGTALHEVLKDCLDKFAENKKAGNMKANGELVIVITDGEPEDRKAVANVIKSASQSMDKDEELAILFCQVGSDAGATKFLEYLDDSLMSEGAKFDIVDTIKFQDLGDMSIEETLIKAIND